MRLAERDLQLLTFITEREAVPTSVLVAAFFQRHPRTGQANRDPEHACRRRLTELEQAGWIVRHGGEHRFVTLATAGARRLQRHPGKPPPLRNAAHHAATVRAITDVLATIGAGAVLPTVEVRMENAVRQQRIGKRFVKRGDDLEVLPDAEILLRTSDGHVQRIAVEYVSAKYSDEQIREKARGLAGYDRVCFFADKPSTALRVMRLTNAGCPCI
ncbi:MAG: hypothetical protein Q8O67_32615 [Deltaproteobacteria bacterium]|nr:hypothetical protein [Deltaproteobacteria bacterium]